MAEERPRAGLRRTLGFWALVAFGVGDILGAGIYALVGRIAGMAGHATWMAFGVALVVACFTALSYAEWGARIPRSAGEAAFLHAAFRRPWLPVLVGWMVLFSGMVSMATVSRVCAEYLGALGVAAPVPVVVIVFLLVLTAINWRGMRHASWTNVLCTVVELAGLAIVVTAGFLVLGRGEGASPAAGSAARDVPLGSILAGGALSFFAFIGFEDMVNVAEEVKDARRTVPRAIVTALALAGGLYMLVAWLAVAAVGPDALAASRAPLLEVVRRGAPGVPDALFTAIAIFAVANTALLNYVMGSRLLYGMARYRLLPRPLARLHPRHRTPVVAILAILVLVVAMALLGEVVSLAGTTSTLLLLVFFTVNVSLLVVKRRGDPSAGARVPAAVPAVGALLCLGLIGYMPQRSLVAAIWIVAAGLVLVAARGIGVRRRRRAGLAPAR
jgi:APA family basic amino acid/polyamine antiporter